MGRLVYVFLCIPVTIIFLSGCWDVQQADEINYITAIGLDESEEDGKVRVTYLIVNPEFGTQPNAPSDTSPFQHISFLADDFFIAKNIANTLMSKKASYVILNQIFVSQELAKKEKFIHWIYDTTKDTEVRRDVDLIVTKESAATFFKNFQPNLEEKPYKYFREKNAINKKTGLIPTNPEIFFYFRITEANNDLFLTTYSSQKMESNKDEYTTEDIQAQGSIDKTQYLGSAVFKQGKMIGTLTGRETMLVSMLHVNYREEDYYLRTFRDPFNEKYTFTTRFNMSKRSKIKLLNLDTSKPSIHATLPITVDVLTNHSMTDYAWDDQKRHKLKQYIEQQLTKEYEALITKTQQEFGSDPFGWSILARKEFKTTEELDNYNWMEKYPRMDIHVNVDIRLGDFGRQSEVPKPKEWKE